jgi:hypothetical protein
MVVVRTLTKRTSEEGLINGIMRPFAHKTRGIFARSFTKEEMTELTSIVYSGMEILI